LSLTDDTHYMSLALQLAERGLYSTHPNPRVGCVVVREGKVVGQGWHHRAGEPHAEVNALNDADDEARGATVYVTLEPCSHHGRTPPCADALIDSGVARVVIAVADTNPAVAGQGLARLEQAGIGVTTGILENPARELNGGFLRRMQGGRPWCRVKMAASLDGRTAMASGESQWITGPQARSDVQRLRARSAAIITGAGTVRADNPSLTVRPEELGDIGHKALPATEPLRVVLDRNLTTPPEARVITGSGSAVIVTTEAAIDATKSRLLRDNGAEVITVEPDGDGQPDLGAVIAELAARNINEVLIEAGPILAGAALASGIVDEFWLYQAPTLLGSNARPMAALSLDTMAQQHRMAVLDRRIVGGDQRIILQPHH
jgi:diaminohydroxyphosphoribosylaminopyrimidine deaminase/5-amino-6-(5-phosphoribosylamino)uracil reductase